MAVRLVGVVEAWCRRYFDEILFNAPTIRSRVVIDVPPGVAVGSGGAADDGAERAVELGGEERAGSCWE